MSRDPLEVALSLAAAGWHVFPVRMPDKRPLVLWGDVATTDREQIATWWAIDHPGAAVGVHAGKSGLVVVDVDEKDGKSGSASMTAAGITMPKTLTYKTPSGGRHHVFTAPKGAALTIAQGVPTEGVDIRAGVGFVVYYGKPLGKPHLAAAPDWSLVPSKGGGKPRTDGDVAAWVKRADAGKPSKAVKHALKAVTNDLTHAPMLKAVSELVKLGSEPGAGRAFLKARAVYVEGRPDRERDWDNAAAGSVAKFGMPPATIPLTKHQRKALATRPSKEVELVDPARAEVAERVQDSNLAVELGAAFRDRLAWVDGVGWRVWDGARWRDASEAFPVELVRSALDDICADIARTGDRRALNDALKLKTKAKVASVVYLLKGRLFRRHDEFDAHPDLLNVANGVVDLRTGELRDHDAALLLTKTTGVRYVPGATSADVDKMFTALPPEVLEWMRLRFGQAATGHTPDDDKFVILQGEGENGKTTMVQALKRAFGEFAAIVPDKLLLGNPGDHSTELTTLMGIRLAILEETPEGHRLNVKRLKDAVGTPELTARKMRQDNVSWSATHAVVMSTNYELTVAETDHGTWRRLALVRFPFRYVPGTANAERGEVPQDRQLRERLRNGSPKHAEAVLAWVVSGAADWYRAGRALPPAPKRVVDDTEAWRGESDQLHRFAGEHLTFDAGSYVTRQELLQRFRAWQSTNGHPEWSATLLVSRLREHETVRAHGVVDASKRVAGTPQRVYRGMTLRPDPRVLSAYMHQPTEKHRKDTH